MKERLVDAAERAIGRLVTQFQGNPTRFWNERDIHWSLFHYLKEEGAIPESHVTQLIRAELPTLKESLARGHYDLVVLDPESYNSEAVQHMEADTPWDEFLRLVKIIIAVEIKLWLAKLPFERADWDIQETYRVTKQYPECILFKLCPTQV